MSENVTPGRLYLARTKYNQNGSQTLGQVSRDTGIDKTLIAGAEKDKDNPRIIGYAYIAKLAKHYGVSADFLLGLTNEPTYETPITHDLLAEIMRYFRTLQVQADLHEARAHELAETAKEALYKVGKLSGWWQE